MDFRHAYPVDDPAIPTAIGYDPATRRTEVVLANGQVLAYRNVSPDLHRELMINGGAEQPGTYESKNSLIPKTLHHDAYRYRTREEADAAGIRSRCPVCGEFTGIGHLCRGGPASDSWLPPEDMPETADQLTMTLAGEDPHRPIRLRTYDPDQILDAAAESPYGVVRTPIRALVPGVGSDYSLLDRGSEFTEGTVDVTVDGTRVVIADDDLRCDCRTQRLHGECRHTREVIGRFRTALAERLEQQNQSYAQMLQRVSEPEPAPVPVDRSTFSYSDDPDRFANTVMEALDRPEGEQVLFLDGGHEPAMYGFGSGREFGVELEFEVDERATQWGDHPADEELSSAHWAVVTEDKFGMYDKKVEKDDGTQFVVREMGWHEEQVDRLKFDDEVDPFMDSVIRERVVYGLNTENLSTWDTVEMHGSTARDGYTRDVWGGWSIELDPSVDGAEVISPILSNTTSSWRTLEIACDTIKSSGGTTGEHSGSHVTVSAGDFTDSPSRMTRLFNVMQHYDHDLTTMACGGKGRTDGWAAELPDTPPMGWVTVDEAQDATARTSRVNIRHIPSDREDVPADAARIEFRQWDSSLDPGTIQAQIKLSAALLDYVSAGGNADPQEGIFSARRPYDPRTNPEGFAEATAPVRRLIDALFHRDVDKIQAATLWASGARRRFTHWH